MVWRLARSLGKYRQELNVRAPNRSKASDGSIGDAAHSARQSDHNPNDKGVVCAIDVTHDPANGADMEVEFQRLIRRPHPSQTYLIFRRRIASRSDGFKVRHYDGANPHDKHMHISASHDYDNETSWWPAEPPTPQPQEDDVAHLIKRKGGSAIYVTDLLYRRWLSNQQDVADIAGILNGASVRELPKRAVDLIPLIGPKPDNGEDS